MTYKLKTAPGNFSLNNLRKTWHERNGVDIIFPKRSNARIEAASRYVQEIAAGDKTVYGINTGFGLLANTAIPKEDVVKLQKNLVASHCVGTGRPLTDPVVRLILALKASSLAQGYSGARPVVIDQMLHLLKEKAYPVIPEKGSVGASGDLAPLAHLAASLTGHGEILHKSKVSTSLAVLKRLGIKPLALKAKEGLAILNGTNVSTALALNGLFLIENIFTAAVIAGSLSIDAMKGSDAPFDDRIHMIRNQPGQRKIAAVYRNLLQGSQIRNLHMDCKKVQDPYSLRCQPQVMGATLDIMTAAAETLLREANSVTDNPLIFMDNGDVISGGNFHAEPVAFAADILALAICEIGSISERRIANLVDPNMSGLPPFLVENSGINSGFMIAQVTAAALTAENKMKAHPASVDSIPTSANQEDHVSMATHGALRLTDMAENAATIIAIELLTSAQGIDFHTPHKTSPILQKVHDEIRNLVPVLKEDRYMANDVEAIKSLVLSGKLNGYISDIFPSLQD